MCDSSTPLEARMRSFVVAVERLAGALLGLVAVLVVISAITRYGFARPLPDAFDVSRLLLGVAIGWGMASLGFHGTHIKVDLLAHGVGPKARKYINICSWVTLAGFTAVLIWKIGSRVQSAMHGGDATMDLRLLHWPFFAAIWVGLVVALITTLFRLWFVTRDGSDLGEFDGIDEQLLEAQKGE